MRCNAFRTLLAGALLVGAPAAHSSSSPGVLRSTLANGLRVVIVPDPLAPVVTTEINYLVGSREAPLGFPGTAHALEHMMFRGSPGLSAAQLSSLVAAMGGDFNADTQQTVTQYFLTVPSEDLDVALRIEALRMRGVLNDQKAWEKERGAIEQEVAQDLSDPQYVLFRRLLAEAFAGTPYSWDALGTRESFQKTSAAMLRQFHDAWYSPSNAILVIAGDVEPRRALAQARRLFETISSRPIPQRPKVEVSPLKASLIELDTDLPYGLAVVAFRLPGYADSEYAAGQVLADVLDSPRSDLYQLVPAGKALSVGFSTHFLPEAGLGYAVAGFAPGTDGKALVAELKGVLENYVKKGFPADLVEAAKRHEITSAEFQKNSISGLAQAWSQALAVEGRQSLEDDVRAIAGVGAADLERVARRCLLTDTAITAILTPRPSGGPTSAERRQGPESFASKQVKSVALPPWARKVLQAPEIPRSALRPTVFTLSNGLRLIVQPASASRTVTVFGRVRSASALETPKGQEGVGEILGELFSYGTQTLDRLAFQKAVDDIGAEVSAGTNFEMAAPAEHFEEGIALLADNLLHPALPEEAFRVVQGQLGSEVKGRLQSPSYLAGRTLHQALFPANDPTLRETTPDTVEALTLQDVRDYHAKVFRPDLTTVVVIGQVTPAEARAAVERYFGTWKASGPVPETVLPPVPPNKPSSTAVPDASRVQDEVILAQTLGITRNHPDFYPLQLGTHVLSGAFYATRLYVHLREELGLVYTVEAALEAGVSRSLYQVFFACDPPNVSKAARLVERDLRAMQTKDVSPEELRRAKALLVRQITLTNASVDGIAEGFLDRVAHGLPLDEPVQAAKRYLKITAPEVRAAFRRWIRPEEFAQITTGPVPH